MDLLSVWVRCEGAGLQSLERMTWGKRISPPRRCNRAWRAQQAEQAAVSGTTGHTVGHALTALLTTSPSSVDPSTITSTGTSSTQLESVK